MTSPAWTPRHTTRKKEALAQRLRTKEQCGSESHASLDTPSAFQLCCTETLTDTETSSEQYILACAIPFSLPFRCDGGVPHRMISGGSSRQNSFAGKNVPENCIRRNCSCPTKRKGRSKWLIGMKHFAKTAKRRTRVLE